MLNYFVTLTSEDSDARGASNQAAFELQQAKIVSGIIGLGADVVGLQEIEYGVPFGKDADVAVAALTAALNEADEAGTWDYVPTPDYVRPSPDVIQNAIVYRSDVVERVGDSRTGGSSQPSKWHPSVASSSRRYLPERRPPARGLQMRMPQSWSTASGTSSYSASRASKV